jgi:chemotaxis regulatin CheY-phosphate phosphatase CheZ
MSGDYEIGPDMLGPRRTVRTIPDDPGRDATDAAHPAWWRGQDYGCEMTVAAINRVLDGLEQGRPHPGHFGSQALEALKRRLEQLLLGRRTP